MEIKVNRGVALLLTACIIPQFSPFLFASESEVSISKGLLGVSYPAWDQTHYDNAEEHLNTLKLLGFPMVAFVPTYYYVGLNKIDFSPSPTWESYSKAVESALRKGFVVVLKPHLDPAIYASRYDEFNTDNHSWRTHTPWRGFFDVDPMCDDYRNKLVARTLSMLQNIFSRLSRENPHAKFPPVRLELGTELMNSTVYSPGQWVSLLEDSRKNIARLGLKGQVILSHDFEHHLQIPEDFILRMSVSQRAALAQYIKGLDALSLSQYMDLTIGVPPNERHLRLPTPDEIALALRMHEKNFREQILRGYLGLKPEEIPVLNIGEFGVGIGGLRHPNLWAGTATPEREKELNHEIALGMEGLCRYLDSNSDRTVRSAVLWTTGHHYDVFGWMNSADAISDAAEEIKNCLKPQK